MTKYMDLGDALEKVLELAKLSVSAKHDHVLAEYLLAIDVVEDFVVNNDPEFWSLSR